jgi:hypothetical protein
MNIAGAAGGHGGLHRAFKGLDPAPADTKRRGPMTRVFIVLQHKRGFDCSLVQALPCHDTQ